jgi:hypothetical protein
MMPRAITATLSVLLVAVAGSCTDESGLEPDSSPPTHGVIVRDTFNRPDGPIGSADIGGEWTEIHDSWDVRDQQARAEVASSSHYGYATLLTAVADGYLIEADVSLSPTFQRAAPGLLANFADNENHLFTKVEVTEGHPDGFMAVGDQLGGRVRSTLCQRSHLGLKNGETYHLSLRRSGEDVQGTVATEDGAELGTCAITLDADQLSAYGDATAFGLRVKIVGDEDDGLSRWDDFTVAAR